MLFGAQRVVPKLSMLRLLQFAQMTQMFPSVSLSDPDVRIRRAANCILALADVEAKGPTPTGEYFKAFFAR